jgi:hypothetical protein
MKSSQKFAYKFMVNSNGEEHKIKIERGFIEAFQKGYSPVEIARVAGSKSAKYIHSVLVRSGLIMSGKPGRRSKKIVLPEALEAVLKIRELSLSQWCAGWGLSEEEVMEGIEKRTGGAVDAFRRDFPKFYCELTGSQEDVDFVTGPEFSTSGFYVYFCVDKDIDCHCAEIKELGIRACSDSYQGAFYTALTQRKQIIALSRLETLPNILG